MISVVFLARGEGAGLAAARRFLESYRRFDAGAPHDLVVLAKGWQVSADLAALQDLVAEAGGRITHLNDDGFDWGAYMRFAREPTNSDWFLFLNSFSVILCENWLLHFKCETAQRNTPLAAASGSWAGLVPPVGTDTFWHRLKRLIGRNVWEIPRFLVSKIMFRFRRRRDEYMSFPNPHIRSNAFFVSRSLFMQFIADKEIPASKADCYLLESGKNSLTKFAMMLGHEPIVVGRDGHSYLPEEWLSSRTFWAFDQTNLMIADNQTETYRNANAQLRAYLEQSAWRQVVGGSAGETSPLRGMPV